MKKTIWSLVFLIGAHLVACNPMSNSTNVDHFWDVGPQDIQPESLLTEDQEMKAHGLVMMVANALQSVGESSLTDRLTLINELTPSTTVPASFKTEITQSCVIQELEDTKNSIKLLSQWSDSLNKSTRNLLTGEQLIPCPIQLKLTSQMSQYPTTTESGENLAFEKTHLNIEFTELLQKNAVNNSVTYTKKQLTPILSITADVNSQTLTKNVQDQRNPGKSTQKVDLIMNVKYLDGLNEKLATIQWNKRSMTTSQKKAKNSILTYGKDLMGLTVQMDGVKAYIEVNNAYNGDLDGESSTKLNGKLKRLNGKLVPK